MTSSQINLFHKLDQLGQGTYFINLKLLEETEKIELLFSSHDIRLTRIKGIGLLNSVYPDISKRSLSDIDIHISEDKLEKATELLKESGYTLYPQKKWMANRHKQDFRREDNLCYSIDLHTKLLFFEKPGFEWRCINVGESTELEPQDHFFYLIYNWIYQDNFVGLHKFYDIYKVYTKYHSEFDWKRFRYLVEEFKMQKAVGICFALLKKYCHLNIDSNNTAFLPDKISNVSSIDDKFLKNPRAFPIKYLFWKHQSKSVKDAIIYDIKWVFAYFVPVIRQIFSNLVK